MLSELKPRAAALAIFAIASATIIGAWLFEYFGYAPCELCLKQRWAYYAGVPLALLVALIVPRQYGLGRVGFLLLAAVWLGSMVFGLYHAGVEWKLWAGPSSCSDLGGLSGGLPDLSRAVVLCDTPAIRILGLSLAGWNALVSLLLALIALAAFRAYGSSSVSQ